MSDICGPILGKAYYRESYNFFHSWCYLLIRDEEMILIYIPFNLALG